MPAPPNEKDILDRIFGGSIVLDHINRATETLELALTIEELKSLKKGSKIKCLDAPERRAVYIFL